MKQIGRARLQWRPAGKAVRLPTGFGRHSISPRHSICRCSFLFENNCYGLSVPVDLQTPGGDITANLASFSNLKILKGDGTNPQEAWPLIRQAVEHVRSGAGPCLLQLDVVRLTGHTFIDDQSYKSAEEQADEEARDPLKQLKAFLNDQGAGTSWKKRYDRRAGPGAHSKRKRCRNPTRPKQAILCSSRASRQSRAACARKVP